MNWVRVKGISLEHDLSQIAQFLHQRGVAHRITEENQQQVVWVADAGAVAAVRELLDRWQAGEIDFSVADNPETAGGVRSQARSVRDGVAGILRSFPLTLLFLALSAAGALLIEYDHNLRWVHWLTLQDFVLGEEYIGFKSLLYGLDQGQWWRLITPIFLHFGIFHILFNGLWLWEFGRRIEVVAGSFGFLALVLGSGVFSNLAQYLWQGPSLFGGMSGVLYALLGYIWLRQKWRPHPALAIAPGIIVFMLVWLVLCMTGAVNWIIEGKIANAAHLGGLLVGMAVGLWDGKRS